MSFLIHCPNCGPRSAYEYRFGGEIDERQPPWSAAAPAARRGSAPRNDSGQRTEMWYHRHGCRRWLVARRNASTNEVLATFRPGDHEDEPAAHRTERRPDA